MMVEYQNYFDGMLLFQGGETAVLKAYDGRDWVLVRNVPRGCPFEAHHAGEAREFLERQVGLEHGDQVRVEGIPLGGEIGAILVNRAWRTGRATHPPYRF